MDDVCSDVKEKVLAYNYQNLLRGHDRFFPFGKSATLALLVDLQVK